MLTYESPRLVSLQDTVHWDVGEGLCLAGSGAESSTYCLSGSGDTVFCSTGSNDGVVCYGGSGATHHV